MENENSVEYLSLIDIMKILKKKAAFIVFITVLCTSIMAAKCIFFSTPTYEAFSTAIIVKGDTIITKDSPYTQSDILLYQKMVDTYVKIAESNLVIDKTAEELKSYSSSQIRAMVCAAPQGETQIIELIVKAHDKNAAVNIANIYCKNFIQQSMNILPVGKIKVLDPAKTVVSSTYPNKLTMIGVGFIFGLLVSIGIVFFGSYMDTNKIRNEKQITDMLNMPVLVVIE